MWGASSHFQRCTCYSTRKATWDCGKCTSEDHLSLESGSQCPAHAGCESGPEAGRKQLFNFRKWRWFDQRRKDRAIHWFLHKFNVDLEDTLRAFKAAACLMCPATAPLLNPTPASVHWPQQLRTFPFLNENIIMDGLCQELPAYGIPCFCGMCFGWSWQHGRSGCKESRVGWRQKEDR